MRRQPAGASPTVVTVVPALRRAMTGAFGSVWMNTAVSAASVSAPRRAAAKERASRAILVFIVGGGRHLAVVDGRDGEEGLDFFRRKLFHAAQRNSFQPQRPDLVTAQPANL